MFFITETKDKCKITLDDWKELMKKSLLTRRYYGIMIMMLVTLMQ